MSAFEPTAHRACTFRWNLQSEHIINPTMRILWRKASIQPSLTLMKLRCPITVQWDQLKTYVHSTVSQNHSFCLMPNTIRHLHYPFRRSVICRVTSCQVSFHCPALSHTKGVDAVSFSTTDSTTVPLKSPYIYSRKCSCMPKTQWVKDRT